MNNLKMSETDIKINTRFKTVRVKTAKRRKISSTQWLRRQLNDPYVKEAKNRGYRSRAAFKILEINEKFKIFKRGYKVLDLGAAPGGWSQMAVEKVGKNNVLALDILPIDPIFGVKTIQKDFLESDVKDVILKHMDNNKYNVVLSDMAANTTGDKKTDQLRTSLLAETALDFALQVLADGGSFVSKIFQGGAEKELMQKIKQNFAVAKFFKPQSSRKNSVETYMVAMGFRGEKLQN